MDQASPASVQHSFAASGLCPVNRRAINTSQMVAPTFAPTNVNQAPTFVAETCTICGNYTNTHWLRWALFPHGWPRSWPQLQSHQWRKKGISTASTERPSFDFKPDCWRTEST
ncbi:uncharacterized protein LOC127863564 [Dreissena polymorpha]|uniref:uncharacterized protein LOC127863564 n=1 Tax=Dreissena polymorpha TaxID=45954 RepID=UPI0022642B64|nr:uncharacterized protein LOC127863564 [Dreissena polymorpha]